ncbi:metallophosphoesterase family protein [Algoriphagus machipongonensis]|uniref:Probable acid phosphatase n=1 Tax=Algoriphagus machipongonensis TaxID=388413 RepID=E2RUG6_9BACT|nr:metallophosphoesterase [Algoriphagus machipongonensis]EFQ79238.1 probable acid phosphatase [Algoriphagus machipongonensis]
MKKFFYCLSLICVALSLVSGIATSTDEFRVLPYLQLYGEGRVQISYFSHSQINSNFELFDDQGTKVWSQEIQANEVPEIYYTSNEQNESISGIAQGSWLYGQAAYKHEAILPELQSGKTYKYTVSLGGSTFSSNFRSKPSQSDWEKIRFIALADSETEPKGRVTRRAWFPADLSFRPSTSASLWKDKFGVTTEQGIGILNYMLTEKQGYQENLKVINQREPDFIVMPGDLVQGSGYQPGWDEFFRQNAGEFGQGLTRYPIIPALGNWENFGALNGGYGFNEKGKFLPIVGRERYYAYFETPKVDDLQKHRQSYYRVDYGPITILTIDSSNGTPDQSRSNFSEEQKIKNQEFTTLGTDTQENYTQSEYNAQGGTDLSSFGPGSDQYAWLEKNLISAKESGQLIFAQFHHIPFSSGEHGVPINHELATGQGGVPMQVLHPLFEEYGVIAVFAGHDELFERSFVDKDNDGKGVMYYDVGVAGDGMRGEKRNWLRNPLQLLKYNPYSLWSADQSEKEQWNTSGANPILSDGGKHYGHLEVNLQRVTEGEQELAVIDFTPVYIFPVLDQNYNLQKVERREYNDKVQLKIPLRVIEEEPQLKEELSISLGEDGAFSTQIADYFKSGYSEDYDYEFSRPLIYTCEDLGLNEVQVKIKKME